MLNAGDIVLDFSFSNLDQPDHDKRAAMLLKDGAKGVIRYSAGVASNVNHAYYNKVKGKLITPAEFHAYDKAGLDIIANDEWYESRVTEGRISGRQDGAAALALWKSCGYNKGGVIIPSWDQAPRTSLYDNVADYLLGFNTGLAGYYTVGLYAGTPVLEWMLKHKHIQVAWRPNAGSWSGDDLPYQPNTRTAANRAKLVKEALTATPAHIWQTGNYWYNKSADENIILRPNLRSHMNVKPKPKPPVKPVVPHYPHEDHKAHDHALVSQNGAYALILQDDGRIELRHNGKHVRNV